MQKILQPSGGYRELLSYKKATIIYDGTQYFCSRHLSPRDRTVDQMVQAARSGKQNIVEGNMAAATSSEMEIKLTNVARASLAELLIDYEDFARVHKLEVWGFDHPLRLRLKEINSDDNATYESFRRAIENENTEIQVNTMLFLIDKAIFLLERHLKVLEKRFIENGGIKERMTRARKNYRGY
ncbi:MAG: four helix bundle suffix domain-containing protein [Rikenellaceae bacterium]